MAGTVGEASQSSGVVVGQALDAAFGVALRDKPALEIVLVAGDLLGRVDLASQQTLRIVIPPPFTARRINNTNGTVVIVIEVLGDPPRRIGDPRNVAGRVVVIVRGAPERIDLREQVTVVVPFPPERLRASVRSGDLGGDDQIPPVVMLHHATAVGMAYRGFTMFKVVFEARLFTAVIRDGA